MRFLLAALFLLIASLPARAESYRYKIVVLNMPIGEATVDLSQTKDAYDLAVSTKFGGIVALFTGADAKIAARGLLTDDIARPAHNDGQVKWGKKLRRAVIEFDSNGDVTSLDIKPKYSYPPKERHPLDPATFTNVQDPLSAMIRPLHDGVLDCNVRLRIFDSKERYDLQFSPTGNPMACNVQPIPISGYKKTYDEKGNEPKPLLMTFAPLEDGKHAIPAKIERDMLLGWLLIERVK